MLTSAAAMLAAWLMVEAGKAKNQLVERVTKRRCPSCGRSRDHGGCICTSNRDKERRP